MDEKLGSEPVAVTCPRCERQTIARLRTVRKGGPVACWACGNSFKVDPTEFDAAVDGARAKLDALFKSR